MALTPVPTDCPLRFGQPEEFAAIRSFFRHAQFDETTLCRVLNIGDMSDFGSVRWQEVHLDSLPTPLEWCVQVFARGSWVDEQKTRSVCGEQVFAALNAVGLLRRAKKDTTAVLCPVLGVSGGRFCDGIRSA